MNASQRGRRNRQRGQETEREVAAMFASHLGRNVCRELGQERDGGCDIVVPPLSIQVKRRKRIAVMEWWHDANASAGLHLPAVVLRADHEAPMILLRLDDFLQLAGDKLR